MNKGGGVEQFFLLFRHSLHVWRWGRRPRTGPGGGPRGLRSFFRREGCVQRFVGFMTHRCNQCPNRQKFGVQGKESTRRVDVAAVPVAQIAVSRGLPHASMSSNGYSPALCGWHGLSQGRYTGRVDCEPSEKPGSQVRARDGRAIDLMTSVVVQPDDGMTKQHWTWAGTAGTPVRQRQQQRARHPASAEQKWPQTAEHAPKCTRPISYLQVTHKLCSPKRGTALTGLGHPPGRLG